MNHQSHKSIPRHSGTTDNGATESRGPAFIADSANDQVASLAKGGHANGQVSTTTKQNGGSLCKGAAEESRPQLHWYLIRTRHNQHMLVAQRLQRLRFDAFYLHRFYVHGNGVRIRTPKATKSYVFARLEDARQAQRVPGVDEVTGPIPDDMVAEYRRLEGERAVEAFGKAMKVA